MPAAPDAFLNRDLLRHLAGEQSFASGERYFASGRVQRMRAAKEKVSAQVAGASTHRVKLWRRQGQVGYECDCEAGRAAAFCKHCVAVGLAWITRSERPSSADDTGPKSKAGRSEEDRARRQERKRLGRHLETLDPGRLVNLVLEATDYDEILWRRLMLETIGVRGAKLPGAKPGLRQQSPDFATYRELLRQAVSPNGHVDYHTLPDFVQGIEEAVAPLQELLRAGWHREVIALAELVLVELDAASDRVDIGDGLFNRIYDDLQRVHLEACRLGTPATELATRLLQYELEGGLGIFNNAVKTYAEVLGEAGVAFWRSLLFQEWRATREAALPLLDHRRFQAQALMERLAKELHDFDALVALKGADLHGIHDQIGLAEWLLSLGRTAEAIRCAVSASRAFDAEPERSVWRGFLLDAYRKAGRLKDALELAWAQFRDAATLEHFRELKSVALLADGPAWPEWRKKAFSLARERSMPDRSGFVELLIEEQQYDDAWRETLLGPCRDDLRLLLAERREGEHPLDALVVYQRHVNFLLTSNPGAGYAEPVALIGRVRTLFRRLHREAEYMDYLAALRAVHRRKRGFMRLLEPAKA